MAKRYKTPRTNFKASVKSWIPLISTLIYYKEDALYFQRMGIPFRKE